MSFNPHLINTYGAAELCGYLKEGALTLKQLNMLKNLRTFSTPELMEFITSGACDFTDMQACGLHYERQEELRKRLALWNIERDYWTQAQSTGTAAAYREYLQAFPTGMKRNEAEEILKGLEQEEQWAETRAKDRADLYNYYLQQYPDGEHALEARSRLAALEQMRAALQEELFADMRSNPIKYTPSMMNQLMRGIGDGFAPASEAGPQDVASRFLNSGLSITHTQLVERGIIDPSISEKDLITPEFEVPQINSFDSFPQDRTDIYFLGVPRSGKSSVLAGMFTAMNKYGNWEYVPNRDVDGIDNSMAYYNGLIDAIHAKKPPVPTALDTINYINIDVPSAAKSSRTANLNFVEISGECFEKLADSLGESRAVWEELGASRVLANTNSKVLFFLLDYNVILGNESRVSVRDQERALESALTIFSNDGPGRDPKKKCTLSRVESVCIIITKSDMMGTDDKEERSRIAREYLQNNFSAFMNKLARACRDYRINESDGYSPYIFTFSLGHFYPGNTMVYDPADSISLARLVERLAPTKRRTSIFG